MDQQLHNDEWGSTRLEYFADRLNLVFSYFFCTLEFSEHEDFRGDPTKNDRTWALQTIHEACLNTTLIALRDLDDFLMPRTARSKDDDLKASDFGFPHAASFLAESERTAINKNIAHSTLSGLLARGFRWDVFEIATKGIRQAMQFLEWIEQQYLSEQDPDINFLTWTAALGCRRKAQGIYDYIAKEVERRRANP
jgi:hypothetical protein